jgi:hypothetical protein
MTRYAALRALAMYVAQISLFVDREVGVPCPLPRLGEHVRCGGRRDAEVAERRECLEQKDFAALAGSEFIEKLHERFHVLLVRRDVQNEQIG